MLDTSTDCVPHIVYRVEVVLSSWKSMWYDFVGASLCLLTFTEGQLARGRWWPTGEGTKNGCEVSENKCGKFKSKWTSIHHLYNCALGIYSHIYSGRDKITITTKQAGKVCYKHLGQERHFTPCPQLPTWRRRGSLQGDRFLPCSAAVFLGRCQGSTRYTQGSSFASHPTDSPGPFKIGGWSTFG